MKRILWFSGCCRKKERKKLLLSFSSSFLTFSPFLLPPLPSSYLFDQFFFLILYLFLFLRYSHFRFFFSLSSFCFNFSSCPTPHFILLFFTPPFYVSLTYSVCRSVCLSLSLSLLILFFTLLSSFFWVFIFLCPYLPSLCLLFSSLPRFFLLPFSSFILSLSVFSYPISPSISSPCLSLSFLSPFFLIVFSSPFILIFLGQLLSFSSPLSSSSSRSIFPFFSHSFLFSFDCHLSHCSQISDR